MSLPSRQTAGYVVVLAVCFLLAMTAGWTTLGAQIDNDAYDFLYRVFPFEPDSLSCGILAIDERTLIDMGGMRRLRDIIASGLEIINSVEPRAVVIDLILADESDADQDVRLAAALAAAPNLVLASDLINGGWEEPRPEFQASAAATGHVHADPDPLDNVTRRIPLEKASGMDRRWALSLEAFRLASGGGPVTESPYQIEVGGLRIPAARRDARSILVRYLRREAGERSSIPLVTIAELRADPSLAEEFRGKVVFVGVTAQSAADDRHMTPYSAGQPMPGVEIHATAYETLSHGEFLVEAPDSSVLLFSLALAAAAGLTFAYRSGWGSYVLGGLLIVTAHAVPFWLFRADIVLSSTPPIAGAWLSVVGAATYQHFVVRRRLTQSETARSRYQQAIHFVTHEMRSPLTAIQGSSELMGRYKLPEQKSQELAQMINAESKRLARMIQTFLDVERISEGDMEIKREPYELVALIDTCFERVKPLAERKSIAIRLGHLDGASLTGDQELMEYAVYNLMNNAVKYSPAETEITISTRSANGHMRISVADQGIGMDDKELKSIFKKFYRTKKAESSGVAGTGIGLAIVEQIVVTHHGRMEVSSVPGQGSTFTIVLPMS